MNLIKLHRILQNIRFLFGKKKTKDRLVKEDTSIPQHIAIIMDGNGRWAQKQGKSRIYGHSHGVNKIRPVIELAASLGVKCISFYAFSKENWNRPKAEVDFLMNLLEDYLDNEKETFLNSNAHLKVIGDLSMLSSDVQRKISEFERMLVDRVKDPKILVNLAVSYGGKDEIVRSVNRCIKNEMSKNNAQVYVTEKMIEDNLDSPQYPTIDLMIRTSGEQRISNFMLWQLAYSELYFTEVLWPDFNEEEFLKALEEYSKRNRRFGKV